MSTSVPVILASVPFAPLGSPSLGLALLQACLRERAIESRVWHLGLDFAAEVGVSEYRLVTDELLFTPDLTGDWIFADALREAPRDPDAWLRDIFDGGDPAHCKPLRLRRADAAGIRTRLLAMRAQASAFIERCAARIVDAQPRVLGLTSVFAQNAAALALAKRVKRLAPHTLVCLGGANAEGVMGETLFERFDFLDVVVSGEGELRFPPIVEARLEDRSLPHLEGVWARGALLEHGSAHDPGPADLGTLPAPDFADYFAQLRDLGLRLKVELPFETSRGCWWGQKHHCTFCGLNGATMAFRGKPASKALAELGALRERHPGRSIAVVDNIIDMGYFRDFLPALAAQSDPPRLFYEVKANLTREQLRLLKAAGVSRIQPGIESLSDDVLRRMRKGLRGLQGVRLLRDARELGIDVAWNILAGFPGENPRDYARMTHMVPLLTHLQPPDFCSAIRLDRFSPLHTHARASGLVNVHAYPAYAQVYDLPQEALDRLAYYFSFDYADGRQVDEYLAPLEEAVARWRSHPGALYTEGAEGMLQVFDEREAAVSPRHVLSGAEAWALRACDDLTTTHRLKDDARRRLEWSAAEVSAAIASLQEKRLMLSDGDWHLALPVMRNAA